MAVIVRDIFSNQGASVSVRDVFAPLSPPVVVDPTPGVSITDAWVTETGLLYLSENGDFYYQLGYTAPPPEVLPPEPEEPVFVPPPIPAFTSWGQTDVTFSQLDKITYANLT